MATASASPVFRSLAHRRVVMAHIGATLLPSALSFAILAPLVGLALIWGSTFVALLCSIVSTGGASAWPTVWASWNAIVAGYAGAGVAAAISGVWIALLSPFAVDNPRYYVGAAIIGMMNAFLFVAVPAQTPALFGGQLFIALVGAVSAFVVAWLLQNSVLKRDEARRDHMSRERAERLAKERAKS